MSGMTLLRKDMRDQGVRMLLAAAVVTAAVLGVFAWDPLATAAGAIGGGAVFGISRYRRDVRTRVPQGALPPAPVQADWSSPSGWFGELGALIFMGAALAGLIAFLGGEESAFIGAIVIGRFGGSGVAALVGARQVAGWERRHGLRVAFAGEDGDEQRFAVHPLGLVGRG